MELQGTFPVLSPEKFSLVDGVSITPGICPQPTARSTVGLVCVVVFFPWGSSHCGVVLAPVRATYTVLGLWCHFGWALAKAILEGAGLRRLWEHVVLARFVKVYCERGS